MFAELLEVCLDERKPQYGLGEWITPSGKIISIKSDDHRRDAYRLWREKGHKDRLTLSTWDTQFGEKFGYVRVEEISDMGEVSIDIISPKVTKAQWSIISKLAFNYSTLVWSLEIDKVWGKGIERLKKELIKKGMLVGVSP